jgi:hypothetical protein
MRYQRVIQAVFVARQLIRIGVGTGRPACARKYGGHVLTRYYFIARNGRDAVDFQSREASGRPGSRAQAPQMAPPRCGVVTTTSTLRLKK